MNEPIFWLSCSLLLVAVCLTIVLVTAIPAFQELARAARSAEKLFDTLYRELPPTLEAIRLTGSEISDLTDDLSDGVESAGNVVKQVDQSLRTAQQKAQDVGVNTLSLLAGAKAAWQSFTRPPRKRPSGRSHASKMPEQTMPPERPTVRYHSHQGERPDSIKKNLSPSNNPQTVESFPISEALETFPEDINPSA